MRYLKMRHNSNGISARVLVMAVALTLIIGGIIGGSVAWLTATSDTVTNTFTTSDIKVELKETKNNFKMVPGCTIEKDPKATVLTGSEECYLFVKLEESDNFDQFLEYTVANGWVQLITDKDGAAITGLVYYRKVDGTDSQIGTAYSILSNDQVTVKGTVTKDMLNAIDNKTANAPTLKVTAYASQLYKSAGTEFTAAEAWANINSTSTPTT